MEIQDFLLKALTEQDNARGRSQQVEIGPSQVGDCRAKVWLQLQGTKKENATLKLPAMLGSSIHKGIEQAFSRLDPFGDAFELEIEVEHEGLKGHIDLYIPASGAVVDWKTTKVKNLSYFPNRQQRWQVHLYGWLLIKTGRECNTVSLVGIPRDGDERSIKVHTEPYDEAIAQEALTWLAELKEMKSRPAPERDAVSFCQHYCEFFGKSCLGKEKAVADDPHFIEDESAIKAALRYLEIGSQVKTLEDEQNALKSLLEGVSGITPEGVSVGWSQIAGRSSVDESEVQKLLGYVPKKQGNPSLRLAVKK